jgi:hypothetical protein
MIETLLWVLPLVGLLVHWVFARYNATKVEKDWQAFMTLRDEQSLETLKSIVEIDHETIDFDLRAARLALRMGNTVDAVRLLRLSHDIIADLTPDRLRRLQAMSVMIRMAIAVTPVEAVPAKPFKGGALKGMAAIAGVFHSLLVTPIERFLLRLSVLRFGFRLALRLLKSAADSAERRVTAMRAWRAFEDRAEDWKTLDREHLETARSFLMSFRLEPRVTAVAERAQ